MGSIDSLVLTFVLNALWQIPVVVAAGLLGDRLLRQAPARHRHALWLFVLAACVLLPGASLLPGSPPQVAAPARSILAAAPAIPAANVTAAADAPAWTRQERPLPRPLPRSVAPAVALAYALFLLAVAARLGFAGWRTMRLAQRSRAVTLSEEVAAVVARCRSALGVGPVELRESSEVAGPVILGARRPVILLPVRFFASASPEEVVSALGHEMAHVRRRDYAVNLACEILLLPVAFHPILWPVRRRIAETREMACDEAVLESLMGSRAYARSLLSLAASALDTSRLSTTLGVLHAHSLEVRMKRILQDEPRIGPRRARSLLTAAFLLLAGAGAAISLFPLRAGAESPETPSGGLKPFVGTWIGPPGDRLIGSDGHPTAGWIIVEVQLDGSVLMTVEGHMTDADGIVRWQKQLYFAEDSRLSKGSLHFRVRIPGYRYGVGAPKEVESEMGLAFARPGEAILGGIEEASVFVIRDSLGTTPESFRPIPQTILTRNGKADLVIVKESPLMYFRPGDAR
jgi:beta-lactamase regulating signal transducer with metallopeptidase domain